MKTRITLFLILISVSLIGQNKRIAERYFKDYAYVKAAELYKEVFLKGDKSQKVLSNLADSYFHTGDMENALAIYKELVEKYQKDVSSKHLFRYSQALKSTGNHKESDEILLSYKNRRELEGLTQNIKANPDYISGLEKNEDKLFKIYNVFTNTKFSDFGAFVKDKKIYFTSAKPTEESSKEKLYRWNKQPYLNLYSADLEDKEIKNFDGKTVLNIVDAKLLEEPIKTHYHEGTAIITKDGRTMYFTRDNYDGKKVKKDKDRNVLLKLYKASLIGGKWTNVRELPFNSDDFSTGHPALSSDERTLYFVSDRPGGYGATDLYKVSVNRGSYGTPQNLGKEINTPEREMFPFIDANNTLYYSTDGKLGLGLLDIFKVERQSNGDFGTPVNLQAPINSDKDDFAYWLSEDGKQGFFSSNRADGKGDDDIYSFKEYEEKCVQEVFGIVTETRTGKIIPDATIRLIDKDGDVVKTTTSDDKGRYSFVELPCETMYTLVGDKIDYKSGKKEVSTTSIKGKGIEADIQLSRLIVDNQIVISPIYFDYDKYNIRPDAAYELENIVTVMKNHPEMVIKIESHTDCVASAKYNRKLSDNRAKSTRDYIISRGIESNRIESAIGYGKDQLLVTCNNKCSSCTDAEHQKNRRSYFYIVSGQNNIKVKGQ